MCKPYLCNVLVVNLLRRFMRIHGKVNEEIGILHYLPEYSQVHLLCLHMIDFE